MLSWTCRIRAEDLNFVMAARNQAQMRRAFAPLVDGLLKHKNVRAIPDEIEQELYFNIIELLMNVIAVGANTVKVDIFGVQA